jgi:hypothetical protein
VTVRFLQLALLLAALLAPRALLAHEATLGVIEFREVRPGAFVGRWTMEPTMGSDHVDLRVPPHCFLRMPELKCGEKGLVGPITITNLGADMSAVLIKIVPIADEPRSYTISTANPVVSLLGAGAPTLHKPGSSRPEPM